MIEYIVDYSLNGVAGTYFVSVSKGKLPYLLIRSSIVRQVKVHLQFKHGDKFKIIDIRENQ
jgi:hypothetical protein